MRNNRTESHQSDEPYTDYPHTINRRSTEWLYTALVLERDLTAETPSTMTQRLQRDLAASDLQERYGALEQITLYETAPKTTETNDDAR
ncbi:hypothetical protein [Halocatena marina]|uniref:Uncharacterized protein n=1 Tax=Halocatena marina TaxID=2934937 RepID=A0ABD5YZ06_9EURY|nr:hypothetical protein [Halocatena marina]